MPGVGLTTSGLIVWVKKLRPSLLIKKRPSGFFFIS